MPHLLLVNYKKGITCVILKKECFFWYVLCKTLSKGFLYKFHCDRLINIEVIKEIILVVEQLKHCLTGISQSSTLDGSLLNFCLRCRRQLRLRQRQCRVGVKNVCHVEQVRTVRDAKLCTTHSIMTIIYWIMKMLYATKLCSKFTWSGIGAN